MCKHFENIEGWIQISILDVLFFVRRKTPSYNYLVKKLFCLWPSSCLTYCLYICWFCLFHFLLLCLHWLYWFCLYLDASFYLVWTGFTKHKNKTWILSDLYWLYWLALNDLMGNLVFIRIVEETILTFNCCWIPNLLFKET